MNSPYSRFIWTAVIGLLSSVAMNRSARAEDWPTFRHDRLRTAATKEKLKLPLEQVWVFRSRQSKYAPKFKGDLHIETTPEFNRYALAITAADGSLFFTSAADGRVVCLDAKTAKIRWQFIAGSAVNRAPVWAHGKIYVGSDDGKVYCLDARTGKVVWQYKAAPADRWFFSFGQLSSIWPVRTDIVVDGGVACFGTGVFPHDGTFVYCLDARTGKRLWRSSSHPELLNRWSLAPVGHIYVTDQNIYMPMDFKPYKWPVFTSFKRSDGSYDAWAGTDPENPGYGSGFDPMAGARNGKVHYRGHDAQSIEEVVDKKTKKKTKKTRQLWAVKTPGYHVDTSSVQGVPVMRGAPAMYDPDRCTVIYAGGVVYSAAYRVNTGKGVDGKLFARDAADGRELWSAKIPEWPSQVIAANGMLFVSTRSGTIHAYGATGSKKIGLVAETIDTDPFKGSPSLAQAAIDIIAKTSRTEGYAVVLDCRSGALAYELAKRTKLQICAIFADGAKATAARKAYDRAGMHVTRIVALHRKPGADLPYPSRFADLIVSETAAAGGELPGNIKEISRLLKPIRGGAFFGGKKTEKAAVSKWIAATRQTNWQIVTKGGHWAGRVAPRLAGAGGWTHAMGDAGHTMCSHDAVLKGPLGVAWYGPPYSSRGSKGISPPIISDGVLVCQYQNYIDRKITWTQGFDQYTGRRLWRREHSLTDTCAGPGSVFQRYLEVIVRLDPWTGKELSRHKPPFTDGKWTGMAAGPDGKTLYASAGGKEWSCILALDVATGKQNWMLGGPGKGKQWGLWSALSDGRMYFLGDKATGARRAEAVAQMKAWLKTLPDDEYKEFAGKIEKHDFRILTAVDVKTGKVLYERGVDISNAGGSWTRKVVVSGRRQYEPFLRSGVIAHGGVVVFCSWAGADKSWAVWPGGGYKGRALAVHDGATGKLLWYRFGNYRARPVVTDDYVIAEPWAFGLRSGKPRTRTHPITGKPARWAFCRYNKQCGTFAGSRHFVFGRSRGIGYHDLLRDRGLYTFLQSRASCWVDTSSGGGMMIKPPHAISCKCEVSMPFTVALAQVPQEPVVPQTYAQPGPSLPVKHLHLDLGATGSRHDKKGNLWVAMRPGKHQLLLMFGNKPTFYKGGGPVRRSANYTPIENTDVPFVFATAARGLQKCIIPLAESGNATYKVRLGFSALPGDKSGQRVFDVKLDGKTVLTGFDIIKETNRPDLALWKTFDVSAGKDLTVELVARSPAPTAAQMPLISGMVVLRK
jgi:outer membrane protein assembly factor BamB